MVIKDVLATILHMQVKKYEDKNQKIGKKKRWLQE